MNIFKMIYRLIKVSKEFSVYLGVNLVKNTTKSSFTSYFNY